MVVRGGTTIYGKGDFQNAIYFIKSGSCEAVYTRPPEILRVRTNRKGRRSRRSRSNNGYGGGGGGGGGRSTMNRARKMHRRTARRGTDSDGGADGDDEDEDEEDDYDYDDDDDDDDDSHEEAVAAAAAAAAHLKKRQQSAADAAGGGGGCGGCNGRLPEPLRVCADDYHQHRQKVAVFEETQWFGDLSVLTDNVARCVFVVVHVHRAHLVAGAVDWACRDVMC